MLSIEHSDKKIGNSYLELVGLVNSSNLSTKFFVREAVDDYFFRNLSYKALKARLDAFNDLNFYTSFKFAKISVLTEDRIDELYTEFRLRTNFFRKFKSFFNITTVLLNYYSKDNSKVEFAVKKSLIALWNRSKTLSEELRFLVPDNKSDGSLPVKKQFVQICCVYNLLTQFIKEMVGHGKF